MVSTAFEVYRGPVRLCACDVKDGGYPPEVLRNMEDSGLTIRRPGREKARRQRILEGQMRIGEWE